MSGLLNMADPIDANTSAEVLLSMKNGSRNNPPKKVPLTRRENPPRIRKRNRFFYNDDEDTTFKTARSSPRKTPRLGSPMRKQTAAATNAMDRKISQDIYYRLRNLLKLPKAHKWVCYEFFYSNIDRPLFKGDNDFCVCLNESFPRMKTRNLCRVEWCKIRRLMGKPRRCSTAFFSEERAALHAKRSKIRLLQQRKVMDVTHFKELPDEIPLPLVIGTKVTARLRRPQDGLFTGSIDAVDTSNATYRVTFDKQGLGTHSIPDYEVLSNEPQETMPLTAFAQTFRPRSYLFTPPRFTSGSNSPHLENDPMLGGTSIKNHFLGLEGETLGGFPVKFLMLVVYLSKILNMKRDKIRQIKDMNTQAEKMVFHKSYQEPITLEFQKRYARLVLDLEKLNKDLNEYLIDVQKFCHEIDPEQGAEHVDQAVTLGEKCFLEAMQMVDKANKQLGRRAVTSSRVVELVTNLTSVMLQVKALGDGDFNSFELKSLSESLNEIKHHMDPKNVSSFQNNVEIHVNHIQSGLSRMGNLHAFSEQTLQL